MRHSLRHVGRPPLSQRHFNFLLLRQDYSDKDEFSHIYTLIVNPDHTYKVLFDNKEKARYVVETWPAQLDVQFLHVFA